MREVEGGRKEEGRAREVEEQAVEWRKRGRGRECEKERDSHE